MLHHGAHHWKGWVVVLGAVVAMLIAPPAVAVDHSSVVKGPFKSGPKSRRHVCSVIKAMPRIS